MPSAIVQNIDINTLSSAEKYALDILKNLSVDQVNQLKQRLKLGKPGIIGMQTVKAFTQLCQEQGIDLSFAGVNAFKAAHHLGNSGINQGVIGTQTAKIYFEQIQMSDRSRPNTSSANSPGVDGSIPGDPAKKPDGTATGSGANWNRAIAVAAQSLFDMVTTAGPDGGNNACAWSVNRVLQKAGVPALGDNPNYVPSLVAALRSGRGQCIDRDRAQPGDLAVAFGEAHVGIVLDDGGISVLSNSSSRGRFRWMSSLDFDGYYGGASTIYRLIS